MWLRHCPVPKLHESMLKEEVEHLVEIGVLEKVNESKWGDLYFEKPKPKSVRVSFLSNFRDLNKQIKR